MAYATTSQARQPLLRKNQDLVPNPPAAPKRCRKRNCGERSSAPILQSALIGLNKMRPSVITKEVRAEKAVGSQKRKISTWKQLYSIILLNRHLILFFNHYSCILRSYAQTERKIHSRWWSLLRCRAAPATSNPAVIIVSTCYLILYSYWNYFRVANNYIPFCYRVWRFKWMAGRVNRCWDPFDYDKHSARARRGIGTGRIWSPPFTWWTYFESAGSTTHRSKSWRSTCFT